MRKKAESLIKNLPRKKATEQMASPRNCPKHEFIPTTSSFPKSEWKRIYKRVCESGSVLSEKSQAMRASEKRITDNVL